MQASLKGALVELAKKTGRYADWTAGERAIRQAEAVPFEGDIPPTAGEEMNQYRLRLVQQPPLLTHARGVTYTEDGVAWVDGRLERRFSIQEIGLRQVLAKPGKPVRTYERATLLQSQTPRTYGDWFSEHLAFLALVLAGSRSNLIEPLLLPAWWFGKPYVQRDLARMKVRVEAVETPVLIEQATVVNKTRFGHYWTREEADAVIAAMAIEPLECAPGSGLYLSREGEKGEGPNRRIRNDVTEAAMHAAGVRVVRTVGMSESDFALLAASAETLFADHGSASYNMMRWQTRRMVELFCPEYWDSAFLFLADSLGIHDYHLWQIDAGTTVDALTRRIAALMSRPTRARRTTADTLTSP